MASKAAFAGSAMASNCDLTISRRFWKGSSSLSSCAIRALTSGKDAVPPDPRRPCEALGCTCTAFFGAPYYEHAYSDRLLEQMLAAKLKQYRKQVDVRSTNTNIDVTGLPDEIVGRIAAGEDREVVIARYIAKHTQQPIALLPKPNGQPDVG